MRFTKLFLAIAACWIMAIMPGCGPKNSESSLMRAATLADSVAEADAGGSVVVASPDLTASFNLPDIDFPIASVGENLFDVFASMQLKRVDPAVVSAVCDALHESGGNLVVIINSPSGESATFTLSPQQIARLQRAKSSELNLGAARNEAIDVAESMVPNPEAHEGAIRVDVSVAKSFLEYDIVWPNDKSYARSPQGLLTAKYFNSLKLEYQKLGNLAEPIINTLTTLGIDGVRVVYSAEGSDKTLKQAFPWREIRLPVVDNNSK